MLSPYGKGMDAVSVYHAIRRNCIKKMGEQPMKIFILRKKKHLLAMSFYLLPIVLGIHTAAGSNMAMGSWSEGTRSLAKQAPITAPSQSLTLAANRRASPAHVGAVMALLATLEDAQALPPETSPEANQLIHTLIQLQAAVMKSRNVAVRRFVSAALQDKLGEQSSGMLRHVRQRGINAVVMEALVDYLAIHPLQEGSPVAEGFLDFNVRVRGLALLQQTVQIARRQLQERGETLESIFDQQRREMPGSSPALPDQTESGQSSHFM